MWMSRLGKLIYHFHTTNTVTVICREKLNETNLNVPGWLKVSFHLALN